MKKIATQWIAVALVSWGLAGLSAEAETYTWAGGTANWDDEASWTPAGGPPGIGDSIVSAGGRMNVRSDITTTISLVDLDFSTVTTGPSILNNSGGNHVDFSSSGTMTVGGERVSIRGHSGGTMALSFNNITMTGGVINLGSAAQANFMATALNVSGTANLSGTRVAIDTADNVTASFNTVILGGGIEMRLSAAGGGVTRDRTINNLSGASGTSVAGSVVNDPDNTNVTTLTLNPASGTYDYAGVVHDGGGTGTKILHIVKTGAGVQVFSGDDNTYSGTTTVNDGGLIINAAHTGTGLVTVNDGGAIGGSGSLAGGLTLNTGADLMFDGTPGAPLTVTGATTLYGAFGIGNLRVADWAAIDFGTYDLLLTGEDFASLIADWGDENKVTGLAGGREAYFTYADDGSDGLAVAVIPEPGSLVLLITAFAGVIAIRRFSIR